MSAAADWFSDPGLIVDLFAGGGGASCGIETALGRPVDIAVNHCAEAIEMHRRNHPRTKHYREDVWAVKPKVACGGRRVRLLWASPACTDHSRAKNGTNPKSAEIRALADVVIDWARDVRPDVIIVENVPEFVQWGPLDARGKVIKARRGELFDEWWSKFGPLGYVIERRKIIGANFGSPTSRERIVIVARCDGKPIVWPEPTHGPGQQWPWRSAAECIDWLIPCRSIFGRKKPLVDPTLRRIAAGINRFVLSDPQPFIVTLRGTSDDAIETCSRGVDKPLSTISAQGTHHMLVAASLIQCGYGEREGQAPRALDIRRPLGTVVAGGCKHALVAALLTKHYGGPRPTAGQSVASPLGTITTVDHHALTVATLDNANAAGAQVVEEFLAKYSATPPAQQGLFDAPRGSVWVDGSQYRISDVGTRMLRPHELFAAQGFPDDYDISAPTQGEQIALVGNSVCPQVAEAIVRANVGRV